jgi:hypothetical protein
MPGSLERCVVNHVQERALRIRLQGVRNSGVILLESQLGHFFLLWELGWCQAVDASGLAFSFCHPFAGPLARRLGEINRPRPLRLHRP